MGLRNIILGLSTIVAAASAMSALKPDSASNMSSNSAAPIEIIGQKFFNSKTREQFFLKGVAYQSTKSTESWNAEIVSSETKYVDPLAQTAVCLRDIPHLQKLGVNTIRVYAIDPKQNHDICMQALADSGIYVLLDLSEPEISIERNNPTWDIQIWERYTSVVDAMQKYPNMLGFFAGNEVTSDETNTDASPFVKAAIRDTKSYIDVKGYRKIPVGYSSNDDAATRDNLAQYFACGNEAAADFYGINMYEWCGYSSYGTSGYRERTQEFTNFPVPVFFSEFGCNAVRPRPFTEVGALFGPKMSKVWSGGLAYMYFEEDNGYGLVQIDENGAAVELEDFGYLQNEFKIATPRGVNEDKYLEETKNIASKEFVECPIVTAGTDMVWKASADIPPSPNPQKCRCLEQVLPCLVSPFKASGNYQKHFDYVCSQVDCSDIATDGEKGHYGEFSDCLPEQKLALQISKMYFMRGNPTGHCPTGGKDVFFNPKSLTVTDPICVKVLTRISELRNAPTSKTIAKDKKVVNPKMKDANSTRNPSSVHSSSAATQFERFGYAFLFLSIIFATMVF